MKYKIKESYKNLKDDKNYNAYGSPAKHGRLMAGEILELTDVPKGLKTHLEEIKGDN